MELDTEETAILHGALEQEREALVHEASYDRRAAPLLIVRYAQRRAVQTGLKGQRAREPQSTVSIEAYQSALLKSAEGDCVALEAPGGREYLIVLELRYERIPVEPFREPPGAEASKRNTIADAHRSKTR